MLSAVAQRLIYSRLMVDYREHRALRIGTMRHGEIDEVFERVTAAIDLIHRAHPWLGRRLPALLPEGVIAKEYAFPYAGEYHSSRSVCVLYVQAFGEMRSVEDLALTIVHEATHARLEARGIGYPEGQRAKVERICLRREAAFARRAGLSQDVIRSIEDHAEGLNEADFSTAHLCETRLAALRARLKETLGMRSDEPG
ncbi:MAG: hypothetical protein AAGG47_03165 [Pseudomonadota bacterium]